MESCVKVHSGTVTGVEKNGSLTVKLSQSQCDGCQLGKLCNVSSGNELILSVATDEAKDLSVGDKVNVEELQNLEHTAIWLCLVLPCAVFLTAVIAVSCIFTLSPTERSFASSVATLKISSLPDDTLHNFPN